MKISVPKIGTEGIFLIAGIALIPVYAFKSGGIQPAHVCFFIFIVTSLFKRGVNMTNFALLFSIIVAYSFAVESIYSFLGVDPRHIIHSVFLFFNLLFVLAVSQYSRSKGALLVVPGVWIAAIIAVAAVLISGVDLKEMGDSGRSTGAFNNPNQLGYFSVCLLSLTYLLYREGAIKYTTAVLFFGAAIFLAVSSLSKAAIVANLLVAFLALKPATSRNAAVFWGLGSVGAIAVLGVLYVRGAFDEYLFVQRLLAMADEGDSSLASRGYFAILQGSPLQIIFGLGNGVVDDIVGHEVHSTIGSFLNNYGVVGVLLFLLLMGLWFWTVSRCYGVIGAICICGPALTYGITHNGSRFTIFWLLVALSIGLSQGRGAESRSRRMLSGRSRALIGRQLGGGG